MGVKKTNSVAAAEAVAETDTPLKAMDQIETGESAQVETVTEKKTKETASASDDASFCVYLGPTIQGVIQSGTVYDGNRRSVQKALSAEIEKHPLIAKLLVTDKTIAEDRIKVKTAGNALNVYYKKLASGKSN